MFKLIDRLMIRGYFKAYAICLICLLSLYIVVDLFTNIDDFAQGAKGLEQVLHRIGMYYGYNLFPFFDRLCEYIVLLAAVFTVAWMQRNNEQVPLLSAGISTRRIVAPVILSASFMLFLTLLNQELIIPRIAEQLTRQRDDPDGAKTLIVRGQYEPTGVHIEGESAQREGFTVNRFRCTIPPEVAGRLLHLTAQEAHFIPRPGAGPAATGGTWEMINTQEENVEPIPNILDVRDKGRYYLHVRHVDFDSLTRPANWYLHSSTLELLQELQRPESTRQTSMAVAFHARLTRPILGLILVFLGLAVILRDQNRNVIISSGLCLCMSGVFFATSYICKTLGENELLYPALAAWLPVLLFGPPALVLFDAVHT
jgi:lipopolysaccharide export system permease protein